MKISNSDMKIPVLKFDRIIWFKNSFAQTPNYFHLKSSVFDDFVHQF